VPWRGSCAGPCGLTAVPAGATFSGDGPLAVPGEPSGVEMNYAIKVEGDSATLSCRPEFTSRDAVAALTEIELAPWTPGLRTLLVIDRGSALKFSKDDTRRIAEILRSILRNQRLRIALVVSKQLHYGIGRMLEVTSGTGGRRFRVFMEERAAHDWLGEREPEG
jgi:hypothetical protein